MFVSLGIWRASIFNKYASSVESLLRVRSPTKSTIAESVCNFKVTGSGGIWIHLGFCD